MDKKTFTDRIYRYIQTTDIDYAIALNGAWGIGKTHFVKSTFIGKNDDWKGIYVSLADKTTPDDAVSWIIQAIIGNLGTTAGKSLKALCKFATQTTDKTTKFIGWPFHPGPNRVSLNFRNMSIIIVLVTSSCRLNYPLMGSPIHLSSVMTYNVIKAKEVMNHDNSLS